MSDYPYPKVTESGRFLLYTVGVVVCVVLMAAFIVSCNRRPAQAERAWGQGYEVPIDGGRSVYMEPDHSWFYYYMLNRMLWQDTRPSYHVYMPPAGYAETYRPWYHDTSRYRLETLPAPMATGTSAPTRTSGGFSQPSPGTSQTPTAQPSRATSQRDPAPTRTTGGFSQPLPATSHSHQASESSQATSQTSTAPSRTTGGFSQPTKSTSQSPQAPSRTSGGFSRPLPPPPPPSSRTTGGFSKPKK